MNYDDDDEVRVRKSPGRKRGRPEGSINKLAREARKWAIETGKLPHEILLGIARGEVVKLPKAVNEEGEITYHYVYPDLPMVVDAASKAAPYFAPKISTVEVISGVADDDLDRIIESAAAAAGISVSVGREGQAGTTEGSEESRPRGRRFIGQRDEDAEADENGFVDPRQESPT